MKKLLALCSFGLVLGLAAVQFGGVQAKSDNIDDDFRENNMKKTIKTIKMKPGYGDMRLGSGRDFSDEYKTGSRFDGCNSGLRLGEDDCKFWSGEKIGSGKMFSGEKKWLSGSKVEKPKKIRWNEFNDDLHKALKFLNLKSLTKSEKKQIGETVSQTRKNLKTTYKQMKTEYLSGADVDFTGYVDKLTGEFSGFAEGLRAFVKEGNESKFGEFIAKKINIITNLLKGNKSK